MSYHKEMSLSLELEGIWKIRDKSKYEKSLLIIYEIFTFAIILTLFFEIFLNLGLVLMVTFLFSTSFVLILDFYTNRYPQIVFPISQIIIFIASAYTEIFLLYSKNLDFFTYPVFPMIPNIFQLSLGILCTGRIIIGIDVVKFHKKSKLIMVPVSNFQRESLIKFESNLKLTNEKIQNEFIEEPINYKFKIIFRSLIISVLTIFLLLTPLWIILFTNNNNIYPYILLIPALLSVLILIIYTTSQKRKINSKKRE